MTREDKIQHILTYLTFAEEWAFDQPDDGDLPAEQVKYLAVPLNYFNGAEIMPDLADMEDVKSYPSEFFNWNHPDYQELKTMDLGLWQHCAIDLPNPELTPKEAKATCMYHLVRYRKMPLSEVRGMFKLRSGDIVESSQAWVYNNGIFRTNRMISERRGSKWYFVGQPYDVGAEWLGEDHDNSIYASKSFAFTRYYEWRVEIGFQMPGRTLLPTVSMATDPLGAKEVYRLRDVPPGKSRRDALRHWVSTHWRRNAYNPEEETKIWAHLRGVEEFTHNGLKCRIIPSAFDVKKAAEYQAKQKMKPKEKRAAAK